MLLSGEYLSRYWHYFVTCLKHLTLKKTINLIKVEYKFYRNNTDLTEVSPYILFIEVSNVCNLRCPICLMGQRKLIPRQNLISYERYVSFVNPLKERLLTVFLYNWAEPFLNPDIYKIIKWTAESNVGTIVSSNLSLPIDAERLVKSELDYLIISGDGLTQEIYEKYRVGGSLELVLKNLKEIVDIKRKLKSRRPYIEWQCLVSKYNEFQLNEIRRKIRAMGADGVRFASLNFLSLSKEAAVEAGRDWLPKNPAFRGFNSENSYRIIKKRDRKPCYWLWRSAVVNPDGSLVPCCLYDTPGLGNVLKEPLSILWNSAYFRAARKISTCDQQEDQKVICDVCAAPFVYKRSAGN